MMVANYIYSCQYKTISVVNIYLIIQILSYLNHVCGSLCIFQFDICNEFIQKIKLVFFIIMWCLISLFWWKSSFFGEKHFDALIQIMFWAKTQCGFEYHVVWFSCCVQKAYKLCTVNHLPNFGKRGFSLTNFTFDFFSHFKNIHFRKYIWMLPCSLFCSLFENIFGYYILSSFCPQSANVPLSAISWCRMSTICKNLLIVKKFPHSATPAPIFDIRQLICRM